MAVQSYEISLRVKYFFNTRREIWYLQAAMKCSIYHINTNEIPNHFTLIVFWCERCDLLCSQSKGDIFTCEDNMLFSMWRYQVFARKLTSYFIGVYIIKDYIYLGTRISSPGNFTLLHEHLRQKALHVLFSLGRHTDFSKLKPFLAGKIFDTMISPILTCRNSEVWSAFVKANFKSWDNSGIEKTQLNFCKWCLEIHNKSSNVACISELGRFPLIIDINSKILNYLNYLQEKDENSIVKQSFKTSVDIYHNGQNSFYSNLKKMTDYYDFPGFNWPLQKIP